MHYFTAILSVHTLYLTDLDLAALRFRVIRTKRKSFLTACFGRFSGLLAHSIRKHAPWWAGWRVCVIKLLVGRHTSSPARPPVPLARLGNVGPHMGVGISLNRRCRRRRRRRTFSNEYVMMVHTIMILRWDTAWRGAGSGFRFGRLARRVSFFASLRKRTLAAQRTHHTHMRGILKRKCHKRRP